MHYEDDIMWNIKSMNKILLILNNPNTFKKPKKKIMQNNQRKPKLEFGNTNIYNWVGLRVPGAEGASLAPDRPVPTWSWKSCMHCPRGFGAFNASSRPHLQVGSCKGENQTKLMPTNKRKKREATGCNQSMKKEKNQPY